MVGDFPRNSLFSGLFATAGSGVMTVCLRLQVNPKSKYLEMSDSRAIWEYLAAMVVLFLTVVNFLG